MEKSSEILIALSTFPEQNSAEIFAKTLIESKLAACVQISENPIISTYIWEDKVETNKEIKVAIKFPQRNEEKIFKLLKETHPYTCPQWYTIKAFTVSKEYQNWILENTI